MQLEQLEIQLDSFGKLGVRGLDGTQLRRFASICSSRPGGAPALFCHLLPIIHNVASPPRIEDGTSSDRSSQ